MLPLNHIATKKSQGRLAALNHTMLPLNHNATKKSLGIFATTIKYSMLSHPASANSPLNQSAVVSNYFISNQSAANMNHFILSHSVHNNSMVSQLNNITDIPIEGQRMTATKLFNVKVQSLLKGTSALPLVTETITTLTPLLIDENITTSTPSLTLTKIKIATPLLMTENVTTLMPLFVVENITTSKSSLIAENIKTSSPSLIGEHNATVMSLLIAENVTTFKSPLMAENVTYSVENITTSKSPLMAGNLTHADENITTSKLPLVARNLTHTDENITTSKLPLVAGNLTHADENITTSKSPLMAGNITSENITTSKSPLIAGNITHTDENITTSKSPLVAENVTHTDENITTPKSPQVVENVTHTDENITTSKSPLIAGNITHTVENITTSKPPQVVENVTHTDENITTPKSLLAAENLIHTDENITTSKSPMITRNIIHTFENITTSKPPQVVENLTHTDENITTSKSPMMTRNIIHTFENITTSKPPQVVENLTHTVENITTSKSPLMAENITHTDENITTPKSPLVAENVTHTDENITTSKSPLVVENVTHTDENITTSKTSMMTGNLTHTVENITTSKPPQVVENVTHTDENITTPKSLLAAENLTHTDENITTSKSPMMTRNIIHTFENITTSKPPQVVENLTHTVENITTPKSPLMAENITQIDKNITTSKSPLMAGNITYTNENITTSKSPLIAGNITHKNENITTFESPLMAENITHTDENITTSELPLMAQNITPNLSLIVQNFTISTPPLTAVENSTIFESLLAEKKITKLIPLLMTENVTTPAASMFADDITKSAPSLKSENITIPTPPLMTENITASTPSTKEQKLEISMPMLITESTLLSSMTGNITTLTPFAMAENNTILNSLLMVENITTSTPQLKIKNFTISTQSLWNKNIANVSNAFVVENTTTARLELTNNIATATPVKLQETVTTLFTLELNNNISVSFLSNSTSYSHTANTSLNEANSWTMNHSVENTAVTHSAFNSTHEMILSLDDSTNTSVHHTFHFNSSNSIFANTSSKPILINSMPINTTALHVKLNTTSHITTEATDTIPDKYSTDTIENHNLSNDNTSKIQQMTTIAHLPVTHDLNQTMATFHTRSLYNTTNDNHNLQYPATIINETLVSDMRSANETLKPGHGTTQNSHTAAILHAALLYDAAADNKAISPLKKALANYSVSTSQQLSNVTAKDEPSGSKSLELIAYNNTSSPLLQHDFMENNQTKSVKSEKTALKDQTPVAQITSTPHDTTTKWNSSVIKSHHEIADKREISTEKIQYENQAVEENNFAHSYKPTAHDKLVTTAVISDVNKSTILSVSSLFDYAMSNNSLSLTDRTALNTSNNITSAENRLKNSIADNVKNLSVTNSPITSLVESTIHRATEIIKILATNSSDNHTAVINKSAASLLPHKSHDFSSNISFPAALLNMSIMTSSKKFLNNSSVDAETELSKYVHSNDTKFLDAVENIKAVTAPSFHIRGEKSMQSNTNSSSDTTETSLANSTKSEELTLLQLLSRLNENFTTPTGFFSQFTGTNPTTNSSLNMFKTDANLNELSAISTNSNNSTLQEQTQIRKKTEKNSEIIIATPPSAMLLQNTQQFLHENYEKVTLNSATTFNETPVFLSIMPILTELLTKTTAAVAQEITADSTALNWNAAFAIVLDKNNTVPENISISTPSQNNQVRHRTPLNSNITNTLISNITIDPDMVSSSRQLNFSFVTNTDDKFNHLNLNANGTENHVNNMGKIKKRSVRQRDDTPAGLSNFLPPKILADAISDINANQLLASNTASQVNATLNIFPDFIVSTFPSLATHIVDEDNNSSTAEHFASSVIATSSPLSSPLSDKIATDTSASMFSNIDQAKYLTSTEKEISGSTTNLVLPITTSALSHETTMLPSVGLHISTNKLEGMTDSITLINTNTSKTPTNDPVTAASALEASSTHIVKPISDSMISETQTIANDISVTMLDKSTSSHYLFITTEVTNILGKQTSIQSSTMMNKIISVALTATTEHDTLKTNQLTEEGNKVYTTSGHMEATTRVFSLLASKFEASTHVSDSQNEEKAAIMQAANHPMVGGVAYTHASNHHGEQNENGSHHRATHAHGHRSSKTTKPPMAIVEADDISHTVGFGVGIPLAALAIIIILIVVCNVVRNRGSKYAQVCIFKWRDA